MDALAETEGRKPISRYSLVVLAAKRAKQIKEGAPVLIDTESTNPLTIAMEEIAEGKVTVIEATLDPVHPPAQTGTAATSPTKDPLLEEAQAGPLLYNGLSGTVDETAEEAPGPAALDLDDPETERLAEVGGNDTSDEDTA